VLPPGAHCASPTTPRSATDLRLDHGADAALQDADGETPLHKAAAEGHVAAAALLLARCPVAGALRDRRGRTPRERADGGAAAAVWGGDVAGRDAAAAGDPAAAPAAAGQQQLGPPG
jgi:ankyrin repeat protein